MSNLAGIDPTTAHARHNAAKITALYTDGVGRADLYRTITAGPSGQRAQKHVARVRPDVAGIDHFVIVDPATGDVAGTTRYSIDHDVWEIYNRDYDGGTQWIGRASSLSLGCDVLINGTHAATGQHDARRVSGGTWQSAEEIRAENARRHTADCAPCRAAGESRGYFYCVSR